LKILKYINISCIIHRTVDCCNFNKNDTLATWKAIPRYNKPQRYYINQKRYIIEGGAKFSTILRTSCSCYAVFHLFSFSAKLLKKFIISSSARINKMKLLSNAKLLIASSSNNQIHTLSLWNVYRGCRVYNINIQNKLEHIAELPNLVVATGHFYSMKFWRITEKGIAQLFKIEGFTPEHIINIDNTVVACSDRHRIILVNLLQEHGNYIEWNTSSVIEDLAVPTERDIVISLQRQKTLNFWDWRLGTCIRSIDLNINTILGCVILRNKQSTVFMRSKFLSEVLVILDMEQGKIERMWKIPKAGKYNLKIGRFVVGYGKQNKSIKLLYVN